MELVCSQGKDELKSASYWDNLNIFEVGGEFVDMLLLWACL